MTLGDRQRIFAYNVGKLLRYIYEQGYQVTFGETWRDPEWAKQKGFANSLHCDRLAIDLNLFKNGVYLTKTEDHKPFGEYWVELHPDNSWGGKFADGNHYSMMDGLTNRR